MITLLRIALLAVAGIASVYLYFSGRRERMDLERMWRRPARKP